MPTLRVNDLAPRVQYVADGVQTGFTAPFFFFEPADLQVRFDDGAEAAAHSVDGAGDPGGGAVLFVEPPPAGTRVTIWREMALERGTEFQEAGAFRAATINDELDRLAMLAQEQAARLDRVPAFAPTTTAPPMALPAPAAGKYLRWTADGLGLESVLPLDVSPVAVTAFAETLLDDPAPAAARATLGLPAAVQNGTYSYAVATGAADAIALAVAPAVAAYVAGQMFWFRAAATNTGPVTLAISGLAAKAVQSNGMALAAGCIRAGDACVVVYDGTQFQLVSARPGGWQLIERKMGSGVPELVFPSLTLTAFDLVKLVINVKPDTDDKDIYVTVSHGGVFAGGTGYAFHTGGGASSGTTYAAAASGSGARFVLTQTGVGNAAGEGYSGLFYLDSPSVSGVHRVHAQGSYIDAGGIGNLANMGGFQNAAAAIDGLKVTVESGGNLTGTVGLYGLRK